MTKQIEGGTVEDIKLRVKPPEKTSITQAVRELNRVRPRVIPYRQNQYGLVNNGWSDAIYDLSEISRASDTESLLSVSFRHHRELLLKEGFTLKSKNARALKAVKKRISEIEAISNRTFESIVRDVAADLIKFHTAFLYKRRDARRSSGGHIRMFGKLLEPVAALEPVDPTSMEVKQNKSGAVIQWRQHIPEQGEEVKFEADEIICITMDRKTGFVFGTPFCLPVLDDILTLRRLEELVDVVATKFAFPLMHYKVGTENMPAQEYTDESGNFYSEVDVVRDTIPNLPTEGSIVTPERHEIIILGADGNVLDLQPYLEHFKDRVMAGLRLSGVEVGQGDTANRGTAVTISKNMADAVKDYQKVLADAISFYLLREILLEEGFDVSEETMVWLKFAEVDQEELRAKENHAMGLYQGHSIDEDEMRERMDIEPITDKQRKRTYLELVEIPLIDAKGKIEVDKAKASAALTANKNRPTNQSGKKATKTKVKKNDQVEEDWRWGRSLAVDGVDAGEAAASALELIRRRMANDWRLAIHRGGIKYGCDLNGVSTDTFFKKIVKKELRKIENKTRTMSEALSEKVLVGSIFDALQSVVIRSIDKLTLFAEAFGMLEGAKEANTHVEIGGEKLEGIKELAVALSRQGN